MTFKIGDKIRCKKDRSIKRTVIDVRSSDGYVKNIGDGALSSQWCFPTQYELDTDPTTEAISLLTSLGYDVVPPKPKLSGKVYVHLRGGNIFYYDKPLGYGSMEIFPAPIAIVDWTEGDGI